MTDDDEDGTPAFNPAIVEPEPCPDECGRPTEDAFGGPCRACADAADRLDDPQPLGYVGPGLHPDWR